MEAWYPHYINYDAHLPKELKFTYGFFFDLFLYNFSYNNIKYDIADFDIRDTGIDLITLEGEDYENCTTDVWGNIYCADKHVMKFSPPIIERWKIEADQEIEADIQTLALKRIEEWFHDAAPITILLENIAFKFFTQFDVTYSGYVQPDMHACQLDFGSSSIEHHDDTWAFIVDQAINLVVVVAERSCGHAGTWVYSRTIAPLLDEYMNHYKMALSFPTLVRGQDTWDIFEVDYRNTLKPEINSDSVVFFLDGGLIYNGEGCTINPDVEP
jgi:hypothetical protein